jgi:hypothetical protein
MVLISSISNYDENIVLMGVSINGGLGTVLWTFKGPTQFNAKIQ